MSDPTTFSITVELRQGELRVARTAGAEQVISIGAGAAAMQLAAALWPTGPGPHIDIELLVIGELKRGEMTLRHAASIGGQGTRFWKPEQAGAAAHRAAIRVVDFLHKHASAEEAIHG